MSILILVGDRELQNTFKSLYGLFSSVVLGGLND